MVQLFRLTKRKDSFKFRVISYGLLILLFLFPALVLAEDITIPKVELNLEKTEQIIQSFLLFEDKSGQKSAKEVLEEHYPHDFVLANPDDFALGYSDSVFWLVFQIKNNTASDKAGYFTAMHPMIDISARRLDPEEGRGKGKLPLLSERYITCSFSLDADTESVYLLRARSKHIMDLHFRVQSESSFLQFERRETTIIAIAAGCFLVMILYNFFLFLTLRDPNYLYYLIFVIINAHLGLLAVKFPSDIFSWFGINWWDVIDYYRLLGPLTTVLFAMSFLQTKSNHPRFNGIFIVYLVGLVVLMFAHAFLDRTQLFNFENLYLLAGIFLLIACGVYSLKDGFKPAKYYLIGLGSFMIGMYIYLASVEGMLLRTPLTLNAHIAGQAAEVILMSLALAGKIKILQNGKLRAEVSAQIKSRLLKVISHDIANPLTVIKGVAHLMSKNKSSKVYSDRLLRSVAMIEEIMSFVLKSEALNHNFQLTLEPVSLKSVFEDLVFLFQNKAIEKGIKLKIELHDPNLMVQAEKTSLTNEVLGNLVSNAIKFSYPGSEVSISTKKLDEGQVVISVKDQGIGICSKAIKNLFDPTLNRSRRGTHSEPGTGYGLPLAKAFVSTFGGEIEVESRSIDEYSDNCGSTFHVYIPAAQT